MCGEGCVVGRAVTPRSPAARWREKAPPGACRWYALRDQLKTHKIGTITHTAVLHHMPLAWKSRVSGWLYVCVMCYSPPTRAVCASIVFSHPFKIINQTHLVGLQHVASRGEARSSSREKRGGGG